MKAMNDLNQGNPIEPKKLSSMIISNILPKIYVWLFLFILLSSMTFVSCKSAKNRAIIQYRLGLVSEGKGKPKLAHRRVKKAVELDPGNEKYLMEASILANQIGRSKLAMKYIDKIPCDQADCPIEDQIQLTAWKAIMALDLGERERASELGSKALMLMDRHGVQNDSLRSNILNNKAVAFLFDQGCNGGEGEPCHFRYVHRRDFRVVDRLLSKALKFNSANCIAQENQGIIRSILGVPDQFWRYGYLPDSIYPSIPAVQPICLPSVPIESTTINYKGLHKTLQHKKELVLVLDISGSMGMTVGRGDSEHANKARIDLMKEACDYLLTHLDSTIAVGAITIGGSCGLSPQLYFPVGELTASELNSRIQSLPLYGGTPLDERILTGRALFSKDSKDKAMLLFSDGVGTCNPDIRNDVCQLGPILAEDGIQFYVLSLLLEKRSNGFEYGVYNCITQATGGILIGVTEEKIEDKTESIDKRPISVRMTATAIRGGELKNFLEKDQQVDSLRTGT